MAPDVKVAAVIVAAGSGKRIGGTVKKQFLELKGKPILVHTLERFQACSDIDEIVLVAPQNELRRLEDEIVIKYLLTKVKRLVGGGEERYNSVYNGLNVLPEYIEIVAVHDGVRPFISSEKISRLVNEAQRYGAAIPGVQPKDTVKSCRQGLAGQTLDRDSLVLVQTPQVFEKALLLDAYRQAFASQQFGTDDAALVERMGHPVVIVPGDYNNIKITSVDDLYIAEKLLERLRCA